MSEGYGKVDTMKTFTITRYETLATTIEITADSKEQAARIADEKFNNTMLDQEVIDVWYEYEGDK